MMLVADRRCFSWNKGATNLIYKPDSNAANTLKWHDAEICRGNPDHWWRRNLVDARQKIAESWDAKMIYLTTRYKKEICKVDRQSKDIWIEVRTYQLFKLFGTRPNDKGEWFRHTKTKDRRWGTFGQIEIKRHTLREQNYTRGITQWDSRFHLQLSWYQTRR